MKVTLVQKRFGAAILVLFAMFSLANELLSWNVFGGLGKLVILAVTAAGFLWAFFVGPPLDEVFKDRAWKPSGEPKGSFSLWKYLLSWGVVMIAMIFVGDGAGLLTGEPVPDDHWYFVLLLEIALLLGAVFGWFLLTKQRRSDAPRD